MRREWSKKSVQSCPELAEGKTAAIFARGGYWQYVSTGKWRERCWRLFSTDPKWTNWAVTLWVRSQFFHFLGASGGCADFRDPTTVFRFKAQNYTE